MGWFTKDVTYCLNCGVETNNKRLCKECNKINDGDVYYCGGCGEEFTRNQVVYVGYSSGGYYCPDCYEK